MKEIFPIHIFSILNSKSDVCPGKEEQVFNNLEQTLQTI